MAMDLLSIARTGVQTSQSQLAITSNNIANVNTEGYNRQVVSQGSLGSQQFGGNFFGSGAYISDVKRVYNDYATRELRIGQTSVSESETRFNQLSQLDELFSQVGKAVPASLNDLFSGLNSLADLPDDLGLRSTVLSQAEQLASTVNLMQSQLDAQKAQSNDEITAVVDRINQISHEIGELNLELMKSQAGDMQLLDRQDALIQELSQYAQVNVIPLANDAKSIMLGGALMLVSGEVSMSVATTSGDPYPNEVQMTASSGNQTVLIDASNIGGTLGALHQYRDETLKAAELEFGQFILGVADAFNQAQSQGFNLQGEFGANIFTDINDPSMSVGRIGALAQNTGNANLRVSIDDVSALSGSSYALTYTAPATYELTDNTSGTVTPLTLNGTQLDGGPGFSIAIDSGVLASGDVFEIRPTFGAGNALSVVMTDASGIAAAAPTITADAANSGNTSIEFVSIDNRNAANFPTTGSELTFEIDPVASTFEVFDASGVSLSGPTAYTAPTITANGFTFEVTSTSITNERFTFDLSYASGDNRNMVNMAELSEAKLMNNGDSSMIDVFETTKLVVGSQTKSAEISLSSSQAIFDQAFERIEGISGVNLDEEAGNLMRFQQSYQASARIMTTASEVFDTLLSSLR